ncbi:exodeoxyribonuclease V subunit gamma [Variovorax sp. UMC13]|uniref:exodeoxyribonuclease V subunit gamma n=1 Tax=Variovorax sp. UMC13 TaxID=1862326 RepID=UPI0016014C1B|nr:exodeoxyribonuclease V subunit gamma [Variovorax sp. UMC13]MBB1598497.1 exodeoxyribonuclease V subunit gamma [Variovorax sp. UMC13]
MTPTDLQPGLLVLHGNRAELLGDALFEWTRRHPLQPLEEEIFLVQSNGVAEWLKMTLASRSGVCAAARVELPARFLWRSYRQVLGRDAVPPRSALDKQALAWRLMHLLPALASQPGYEPLAGFLRDGDMGRRLQLASRLADLYDQYQVYRGDWLAAWEAGRDVLPGPRGETALPPDQRWQAALWRELLEGLSEEERFAARSNLHRRFIAALDAGDRPATPVARRVMLFGMTHVPMQTLEALAALSAHSQVLMAIPNPSRYHWADIIEGRELLRMERRRQPLRAERDLALVPLDQMHAHGHPLLAAWGRQGRDFVRQLDAFDDADATRQRFGDSKIDLFDEAEPETLLQQVQAHIRDLLPLGEHPHPALEADDRSIVFHIAHGAQREVEILHDQLLALLADPPGGTPLNPRDIVVMVPDVAAFAPAIRSVFGQHSRGDARFIPFDIADLSERGHNPLLVALEWLLRLPQQRCGLTEIRDLLDVPAVAARFGLDADALPRLARWMEGAGIRWGLDLAHRRDLGLAECGEQNTWLFGLRRMLLGYASGEAAEGVDGSFQDIEPYAEVGGLEATIAGALADLVEVLGDWWVQASTEATPAGWAERSRALLEALMAPTDERERLALAAAQQALGQWLEACELAGFDAPVSLAVAREAWLEGIDEPGLSRRFRAGGVTFCTLLPMRAVPFEVVCLLGMNDGDYPRSSPRSDFDLMGLPGQRRPGDRSRRDDDRQLMLEALLSARRVLYLSWTGRSVRDNSEQPPSVLVSQLRDYLAAGWHEDVVEARTTEHPLQPFSRRYFEGREGDALFTHAREWRTAHEATAEQAAPVLRPEGAAANGERAVPLTLAALTSFLKNPVKDFFRRQLDVVFQEDEAAMEDHEAFALDGLEQYGLLDEALTVLRDVDDAAALSRRVDAQLQRIRRSGRLPMAELGRRAERALADTLQPMLARWRALHALYPVAGVKEPLRFAHEGLLLDDWLDGLRLSSLESGEPVWMGMLPTRLASEKGVVRPDKLIALWVNTLVSSACGAPVQGVLVGRDATLTAQPLQADFAMATLRTLLDVWREGMGRPLPLAPLTALEWLAGGKPEQAYEGGMFVGGEVQEPCLARVYPDHEALRAGGEFEDLAEALFAPLRSWAETQVTVELHAAGGSEGELA